MSVNGRSTSMAADDPLRREGELIARYLVDQPPAPQLLDRYGDACRVLFDAPPDAVDAALLAFVGRHPWSLGPLEAAAGLRRPAALLRSKVLVMAAVLETSPPHADEFLPRDTSLARFLLELARHGTAAVARVVAGLVLWPAAVRAARTAEEATR